jgi:flagellar basal body P-ring formation protein FlgA
MTHAASTSSPRAGRSALSRGIDTQAQLGFAPVQWWLALGSALLWLAVVALAAGGSAAHASAGHPAVVPAEGAQDTALAEDQDLAAAMHTFAKAQSAAVTAPGGARIEVVLGSLDSRIKLAPCKKVRTYWPAGQRAWGAGRVGMRCEQGSVRWNVYWPVVVKAWVRGVVAMAPLSAGKVIAVDDLQMAEVDLSARAAAAVIRPADVLGRTLARGVAAGQALRADDFKPRRYFAPGEPVALTVRGDGFQVAGQGTAITAGDEGQCARIRTDSGRVVCGTPVGERRVEIVL